MSLKRYRAKRDLRTTPEPGGDNTRTNGAPLIFVVQRHKASHLHYDLRLEMEGVLKSWAVPKGPSLSPQDRRLAMMVEDHPYDYKDFHGVIPEGHYGAGIVEIWDHGTYVPVDPEGNEISEKQVLKDLKNGSVKVRMKGRKLKGEFALVRMKDPKTPNAWLLIKHRDAHAVDGEYNSEDHTPRKGAINVALKKKEKSTRGTVRSGTGKRTQADRNADRPKPKSTRGTVGGGAMGPTSRRSASAVASTARMAPRTLPPVSVRGLGRAEKLSHFIRPMLARQREDAFDGDDWIFEIKWDGYRAIAETGGRTVRLYSRNGLSFERAYPDVMEALGKIDRRMVLDGEIVALDAKGRPSFQLLQNIPDNPETPLVYYVFDLLELDGKPLDAVPLVERKKQLRKALKDSVHIRFSDHVDREGKAFFTLTGKRGLEGMMAKRADSTYTRGARTSDWLKVKHHEGQEVVIGGYTAPRNSRQHFGALLLGVYRDGALHYVGHTGTGFSHDSLRKLSATLKQLERATSPFAEVVKPNSPPVWVQPKLVCNVKFAEWTADGHMRQPVFMGLRADKKPTDVHPEKPSTMATKKKTATKAAPPAKKKTVARKKAASANEDTGDASPKDRILKVGKQQLKLTNQNKVYWPKEGFTKGDLVAYYDSMHTWILPYLKDRPESLKRNPGGITGPFFYQKDAGRDTPEWVRTESVPSKSRGEAIDYIVCNDRATLLYLANLGCIEMNPWTSRIGHLDKPDHVVIDLDPGDRTKFDQVVEAALATKVLLDEIGGTAFCKTSGASGLHIYIPVNARYTYTELAPFTEQLAQRVVDMLPRTSTVERTISKRGGKMYIDHLQNRQGQTLASAYSVRPVPGATVSTPLAWKEVVLGLDRSQFNIRSMAQRVAKVGDLFSGVLGKGIDLVKCMRALDALG